MPATLAITWPPSLPPLNELIVAAHLELQQCRQAYAAAVANGLLSREAATLAFNCRRALVVLGEAELRRHQAWPPLSPQPPQVLDWLNRQVRAAQRNENQEEMRLLNVLRWMLNVDVAERLPDPSEFERDLLPPPLVVAR